jgi:hypothetical protein
MAARKPRDGDRESRRMAARTVAGGPSEASDHRNHDRTDFPTAAAVAEGIHDISHLVRDTCRCRKKSSRGVPVVARFARTTGYRSKSLRRFLAAIHSVL